LPQADADQLPDLCDRFQLESVPAFFFLHAGKVADKVLGADVPTLVNKTKQHDLSAAIAQGERINASGFSAKSSAKQSAVPSAAPSAPAAAVPLEERLKALTHRAPVMLFMKGTPDEPKCGFSRQAVELLRGAGVAFDTFDILGDEEVRQGLKAFSNWPTYPQLYGDGTLVGGLDIMKELHEEDELAGSLPAAAKA
jgi:Grx4 family monothiol glutaredoxin